MSIENQAKKVSLEESTGSSASQVDPSTWVERSGDYLFRYANSRLRDVNAAEEVVQETFLAGVRYVSQYAGKGSEQAWLLGILKRKIIDYVRRRVKDNRATSYEDDHDPSSQLFDAMGNWKPGALKWATDPGQEMEMQELWAVVKNCLTKLPSGQADVFTLSVMEEMDSEQICESLDITPSNFWVRMHRARVGLATCVSSRWHQDSEVSDDG